MRYKLPSLFLGLYFISLMVSTAGMEIFSSLVGLCFLITLAIDLKNSKFKKIKYILSQPPIYLGMLFFVANCLSAIFSPVAHSSVIDMIGINRSLLLLIGFIYLFPHLTEKPSKPWLKWILFTAIFVCFYAYFQCVTGLDLMREKSPFLEKIQGYYRAIGFFAIPLTFAYSFGMIFFLLLPVTFSKFISQSEKSLRVLAIAAVFCIPFAVLASGSRGAWVAMALVIALYAVMSRNKNVILGLFVLSIAVLVSVWNIPYLNGRVTSIVDLKHTSNSARFTIWKANYEIFKDYFWLGAGPNQSDYLLPAYYKKLQLVPPNMLPPTHHAHSDMIQVAAGSGVIGLVSYLLMSLSFLWVSLLAWLQRAQLSAFQGSLALGCFLSQIFFHLGGLTQCNYIDREVNHVLLVVWFFSMILYMATKSQKGFVRSVS